MTSADASRDASRVGSSVTATRCAPASRIDRHGQVAAADASFLNTDASSPRISSLNANAAAGSADDGGGVAAGAAGGAEEGGAKWRAA